MPKLSKTDVEMNFLDRYGELIPSNVPPDKPIDDDFTVDKISFATSASGYFTVNGSLYFNNTRRIRLCHKRRPKISSAKTGLSQYCLKENGALFYKDFEDVLNNAQLMKALANMNAISTVAPRSGVLCEFWGTTGRHISRGQVIVVKLTQFQVNLLYIGGVMESNSLMKTCWLAADLAYV
ncbi:hypothetical protein [Azospirillum isscasi]|uniref:Uncharacterized protein n=1 Tax=Azospirillum isscasi TaxID=3053926 RepID=A0ABU0WI15_9PROT|nr:hypothetical protein [Azospirillum isscasi]MDQ2103866.1 hypothetical protein [Azospirillum isscasi]